MYGLRLFYCYIVITGKLASSQTGCDLKLDQIFRTPTDFSKVNFDHFEIIERNNFESTTTPPTVPQDVGPNAMDHPPKSVANAQVMLRFGGDNMHNCRGIPIPTTSRSKSIEKPYCNSMCPRPPTVYPYEYGYPVYPAYLPSPQCGFPYPQPPYNFPGCYYGVRGVPTYIPNPYGVYNGPFLPAGPNEAFMPSQNTLEDRNAFLGYRKQPIDTPCAENQPNLVRTNLNLNGEKVRSINNKYRNIQNAPNVYDQIYLINQDRPVVEETVVETPFVITKPEYRQRRPSVVEETFVETTADLPIIAISNPETIVETTVDTPIIAISKPAVVKISSPNYYPNQRESKLVKEAYPSPTKDNIIALLDQALVPLTCQKCQQKRNLLVTYPITNNGPKVAVGCETIEVPQCPCCTQQGACGCCNRERNSSIPYGKRFSKDLDSLLDIVPESTFANPIPRCTDPPVPEVQTVTPYQEPVIPLPPSRILNQVVNVPLLYGGYKRTSESYFSTAIPDRENPVKGVYKEPTTMGNPVEEKNVEPQLYQVIPKRGDAKSLNIPDLVPTNTYLCANCNKLVPRIVCHREFVPVEGGSSGSSIKEAPISRSDKYYCPTCSKYMGELNEVSSKQ